MIEYIGNVQLVLDYYTGVDQYSDGSIEEFLLDIVRTRQDYQKIVYEDSRWPVYYHLSNRREYIVQPMNIKQTDDVLEIGAGCGAITGALLKKAGTVDCVELSKKRTLINAYRHKESQNLRLFVGNLQDIRLGKKYDVITLIGVLEYAGKYAIGQEPYVQFLQDIRKFMKPGARLYIAIENRFGMKYFSGCVEDHIGKEFEGIEGYPGRDGIRTFSRAELINLLKQSGFEHYDFYYIYPDYKFPTNIFTEESLSLSRYVRTTSTNSGAARNVYFDEHRMLESMTESDDLRQFANSFMVEASWEG